MVLVEVWVRKVKRMKLNKGFFKKKVVLPKILKRNKGLVRNLQTRLEERRKDLLTEFDSKHKETIDWLESKGVDVDKAVARSSRGALAGLVASMLVLSTGNLPEKPTAVTNSPSSDLNKIVSEIKSREAVNQALLKSLQENLPKNVALNLENEQKITTSISKITGVKVMAELNGNRLNTNYGKIGLEQHMPLYPGDNIADHFTSASSANVYGKSGMTRNKGAFGYFAPNKYVLTTDELEQEKYYVVVQTFAIPGWGKNPALADWYKHRKVLVVNTENGTAVVGDIADSGPAKFTGKSFGGSPELIDQLGMYSGNRNAKVLIFFLDDSQGSVKLGPL